MNFIRNNTRIARVLISVSAIYIFTVLVLAVYFIIYKYANAGKNTITSFGHLFPEHNALYYLKLFFPVVYFAQVILFYIWFYLVYRNLKQVSPEDKKFPAWLAIVSWLIPIVDLVLPFLATIHIRKAYRRTVPPVNFFLRSPFLVICWWVFYGSAMMLQYAYLAALHYRPQYISPDLIAYYPFIIKILQAIVFSITIAIVYYTNRLEQEFRTLENNGENGIFSVLPGGKS